MLNNKKLIALLLSGIAIAALITFTLLNGSHNVVTGAVNDAGGWVGRIFSAPANGVVGFVDSVDELINTHEENQKLKKSINQVNELQVRIADLEAENEKMRQELDLSEILSNYEIIHGTVISRNPDQWIETLTVNVGSNQGVEEDMAVMAGNGLIGRVIEVNPTSSKVVLLTSQQSNEGKVAASIQTRDNSSANGIISGYDPSSGHYIMTQVNPEAKIEAGDMVITSGLGGIIPSSLLIGEVVKTSTDDHGLFQVVEIMPAGELTDIRFVTIIKRQTGPATLPVLDSGAESSSPEAREGDGSVNSAEPEASELEDPTAEPLEPADQASQEEGEAVS
ncbi:rod shape-determining protein MreC [Hutsoniella sourekii]|uniref:rod shape-determining protein MreC n=1 Tax=Hutsoniella sourekii TaxID=87650 RepID=UPI0004AED00C|nr:rod shape-determining protein MreC [Hutsoniella sourekii]